MKLRMCCLAACHIMTNRAPMMRYDCILMCEKILENPIFRLPLKFIPELIRTSLNISNSLDANECTFLAFIFTTHSFSSLLDYYNKGSLKRRAPFGSHSYNELFLCLGCDDHFNIYVLHTVMNDGIP
jgi:hypothetical protein